MKWRAIICLGAILFCLLSAKAQKSSKPLRYLSGQFYSGALQVHSSRIEHFRGVNPTGIGFDFAWKFISENAYVLCHCYPSLGVSVNYWDFGHSALGHGLSTLFYVEPVLFSPFGGDVSIKTGLGISFLDHPYQKETNPLNITYSTRLAFPLMIGGAYTQNLTELWAVRLSAEFQHISNGGVNQPNLGINYGTIGFAVQRKLDDRAVPSPVSVSAFDPAEREPDLYMTLIAGMKEPAGIEEHAFVGSFSGEYLYQFGRINAFTAGGMLELDNSRIGLSMHDKSRASFMAGHTFLLGRFAFAQKGGIYVWSGHSTQSPFFQYYTLDFGVNDGFGIGFGLKAHGKVAEFVGIRLLYRLF